jgi:DNA-binding transcriptional MerR regulator
MKKFSLTVGQLAKKAGVSRSTLLYYDSIGLLKPSGKSAAHYRQYSREDALRLEKICRYRKLGLSLASITEILSAPEDGIRSVLEKRLAELVKEISRIREQQHVIVRMLHDESLRGRVPVLDKESWVGILRAAGLDETGMRKWHKEFEKRSPLSHQEFLEGLGITPDEIRKIRKWARA